MRHYFLQFCYISLWCSALSMQANPLYTLPAALLAGTIHRAFNTTLNRTPNAIDALATISSNTALTFTSCMEKMCPNLTVSHNSDGSFHITDTDFSKQYTSLREATFDDTFWQHIYDKLYKNHVQMGLYGATHLALYIGGYALTHRIISHIQSKRNNVNNAVIG